MADRPLLSALRLIGALVVAGEAVAAPAAPSTTAAATWLEVSERTACEAMQDEYCAGRYGFTVRHDGTFVAGGSGASRTIEGKIASQELQQLSLLIREASRGALGAEQMCRKEGLPGIKDQVDLTFKDGAVVRIYDLGGHVGQVCYIGDWHRVHRLHGYFHSLMSRYYPVPFPAN